MSSSSFSLAAVVRPAGFCAVSPALSGDHQQWFTYALGYVISVANLRPAALVSYPLADHGFGAIDTGMRLDVPNGPLTSFI